MFLSLCLTIWSATDFPPRSRQRIGVHLEQTRADLHAGAAWQTARAETRQQKAAAVAAAAARTGTSHLASVLTRCYFLMNAETNNFQESVPCCLLFGKVPRKLVTFSSSVPVIWKPQLNTISHAITNNIWDLIEYFLFSKHRTIAPRFAYNETRNLGLATAVALKKRKISE